MLHKTSIRALLFALPLLALIGCGDDDGGSPDPLLRGTLAYVVFECRVEPEVLFLRWELRVRKGEGEAVTVTEYEVGVPPDALNSRGTPIAEGCELLGMTRLGPAQLLSGSPIHLVAVSPDGSRVAFELTEQFLSGDPPPNQLPPEAEGIFIVNADGSNLRRLGPASSVPSFIVATLDPSPFAGFTFSPDSRRLVFVDQGVGPAGEDALQVWTQDVVSGERIQVTSLPSAPPECLNVPMPRTCCARFLDNETIEFATVGLREVSQPPPCPGRAPHTVKTNGEQLREIPRNPIASENPQLGETFIITGERPAVGTLLFPGAQNEITCPLLTSTLDSLPIQFELFYFDGDLLLQLTDFQFSLTAYSGGSTLSTDGSTAIFTASADPFGTNPSGECQLFSVDVLGSDLRQLTSFKDVEHSTSGCASVSTPDCGCTVVGPYQDPWTEALVFYSSCDPFGTNPYGGEIFAMRPDGTEMRQITETRGFIDNRDSDGNGGFVVELPGPYAYSSKHPGGYR